MGWVQVKEWVRDMERIQGLHKSCGVAVWEDPDLYDPNFQRILVFRGIRSLDYAEP